MIRNTMPAAKLTTLTTTIRMRNPTPPSERWGVMMAENSVGSASGALPGVMALHYTGSMATRTIAGKVKTTARKTTRAPAKIGKSVKSATPPRAKGKAKPKAKSKPKSKRWSAAEIEEAFRRFHKASPEPRGELQHINPYTLLVAVVLSAQATDAGVNKATPALFAAADTPEKMVALGEAKVRDYIKTIGLFNTKAKNVIALSEKLIAEHGGVVPPLREALEALPGVGRKTANVVLNIAFGQPTIAVDTHIFRVGNRTGLAPGKNPLEVEAGLEKVTPAEYKLGAHHRLLPHGRYVSQARHHDAPAA